MDWLTSHSAALTAAVTAISALWAGLHHVDKGLKAHLSTQFASREDLARLEAKVDTLISVAIQNVNARRK